MSYKENDLHVRKTECEFEAQIFVRAERTVVSNEDKPSGTDCTQKAPAGPGLDVTGIQTLCQTPTLRGRTGGEVHTKSVRLPWSTRGARAGPDKALMAT